MHIHLECCCIYRSHGDAAVSITTQCAAILIIAKCATVFIGRSMCSRIDRQLACVRRGGRACTHATGRTGAGTCDAADGCASMRADGLAHMRQGGPGSIPTPFGSLSGVPSIGTRLKTGWPGSIPTSGATPKSYAVASTSRPSHLHAGICVCALLPPHAECTHTHARTLRRPKTLR